MFSTTTGQVGFFDAAELMGLAPEGSFFALLAEHGGRIVRDEDFAHCYSVDRGRPSIPPSQLAKVMLLQYRTGLSDEQAMEAVAWDLRWKIALELPVDHRGWNPSTLTRHRARLLLHGSERLTLENTLALAEELGLLDAPAEQIVDSTPMLGAAATPGGRGDLAPGIGGDGSLRASPCAATAPVVARRWAGVRRGPRPTIAASATATTTIPAATSSAS
jgi:transposase